ncbi:MAG: XdhC family protein [Pseudomonadota bacterium]
MLNPVRDPIEAILQASEPAVLAVIAGIEGPSYRPLGAMMAILPGAQPSKPDWIGSLSSGCVEADIALHAMQARQVGASSLVRYGRGSPFLDIQLPCGGGLEIGLVPDPDCSVLQKIADNQKARIPCALHIDLRTGAMRVGAPAPTQRKGDQLTILFEPGVRFLTFGKGPEANTFAALVQSAGYANTLFSPDAETLQHAQAAGCPTAHLAKPAFPDNLAVDDRTAITLFFHDHDWEPPLLVGALQTDAFYIGAQGSRRARDKRMESLHALGVSKAERARLYGPVGLIPSARDPGTLAVSVLAEILASAMPSGKD